jgi:hypothetical protein
VKPTLHERLKDFVDTMERNEQDRDVVLQRLLRTAALGENFGEIGAVTSYMSRSMPEADVSPALAFVCRELGQVLIAVAAGHFTTGTAPEWMVTRASRAVLALYDDDARKTPKHWQWGLEAIFATPGKIMPARDVLELLVQRAPDAPASLLHPKAEHLRKADALLSKEWSVEHRKPDHGVAGQYTVPVKGERPIGVGGRGHITAWGLARRFAACFGEKMPGIRDVTAGNAK